MLFPVAQWCQVLSDGETLIPIVLEDRRRESVRESQ